MGLDMYVYRVRKPSLDTGMVYDRNDLDGIVIHEADIDEPRVRQLIPYSAKVRVVNHYYNLGKIGEDYGLSEAHIGGWECGDDGSFTTIYGDKDGRSEFIKVSDELIESKYTIDKEETCYVCSEDEVRYWRKAYDVQDWFHENIPEPVENTGYYILTEELLKAFNKAFPEDKIPKIAPDGEQTLVYWEWY